MTWRMSLSSITTPSIIVTAFILFTLPTFAEVSVTVNGKTYECSAGNHATYVKFFCKCLPVAPSRWQLMLMGLTAIGEEKRIRSIPFKDSDQPNNFGFCIEAKSREAACN